MSRLYQDDVGARLLVHTNNLTIPVTAVLTLVVTKPSGTEVVWAIAPGDIEYATGILTYTTVAGDFDETGEYRVQVHGVFTDADESSNIDRFTIHEKL